MEIAGLVVAVIALVVSAAAYAAAVDQNRLGATAVYAEWLRDMRTWGSEAIDVLAEAAYRCSRGSQVLSADEELNMLTCRHRLSSLIDRGRLLLPNERKGEVGGHKAGAFRGVRHIALDALVAAERVLGGSPSLGGFPNRADALVYLRREFVSEIQGIVDPASFNKDIGKILRSVFKARADDPTLGGLPTNGTALPKGADGVLRTAYQRYEYDLKHPSRP